MECPICANDLTDQVHMTCGAKHAFCFKCILKDIETNFELRKCPTCRGGDKFLIIDFNNVSVSDNFESLCYLKKSIPIIQSVLGNNSCLISEKMLLFYIKNKKQIDIVHKLIENNYNLNDIVKLIKWSPSTNKAIDDIISSTVLNIESDSLGAGIEMLSAFLGNTTR